LLVLRGVGQLSYREPAASLLREMHAVVAK
jgi:hypothetical protein